MFSNLIESESRGLGWLRHPWIIGLSLVLHVILLGSLVWAARVDEAAAAEQEIDPEDVTYVDVTEIPPPPEPEPVAQETPEPPAQQPQPEAAPSPMPPRATPPEVTAPEEPAGFQELQEPEDLAGIPEPAPDQEPVEAEDFGGRGTPGGVAGGEPPEETGGGGAGRGEAGGVAGGTYTANMVDRAVTLRNASELLQLAQRRYPSHLRQAGVGGNVVAQFVVGTNGRIEPGTIRIISAPHPDLAEQTRQLLLDARFRPAQKGDQAVRQLARQSIQWTTER